MTALPPGSDDAGLAATKKQLRERIRAARDALTAAERAEASAHITRFLRQHLAAIPRGPVLAYSTFGHEFDTVAFNSALLADGRDLILPRVDRATKSLVLHRVADPRTQLLPGIWGILEPDPAACPVVMPSAVRWVLVPGLAFDPDGGRLGYGGGFYDGLLPQMPDVPRIAAAFSCQIVDRIPRGPRDALVDRVITERGPVPPRSG